MSDPAFRMSIHRVGPTQEEMPLTKKPRGGVEVYLKCPRLEEYFQTSSRAVYEQCEIAVGPEMYLPAWGEQHEVFGEEFETNGLSPNPSESNLLVDSYNGWFNASFLRGRHLSQGITYHLGGLFSTKNVKAYAEIMQNYMQKVFHEFFQKISVNINVTSQDDVNAIKKIMNPGAVR